MIITHPARRVLASVARRCASRLAIAGYVVLVAVAIDAADDPRQPSLSAPVSPSMERLVERVRAWRPFHATVAASPATQATPAGWPLWTTAITSPSTDDAGRPTR